MCDNTPFMNYDIVIMSDGMGANLALKAADEFTSYVPEFRKGIIVVLSDPIISWKDNFSALDAYLEGRGKYTSLEYQNLLTNQQTDFMLTPDLKNEKLKNLIKNLNQACTKNIYDVTDSTKHYMPSGSSYEIFDSLPLCSKNNSVDALCGALLSELKGIVHLSDCGPLVYTPGTDAL